MTAKEKGYGTTNKRTGTVKVLNEEHLRQLLSEGNEHFFAPGRIRGRKGSEKFHIHLGYVVRERAHYWFIYYEETDEQQEIPKEESFMTTWLRPYIERGILYCGIYNK